MFWKKARQIISQPEISTGAKRIANEFAMGVVTDCNLDAQGISRMSVKLDGSTIEASWYDASFG